MTPKEAEVIFNETLASNNANKEQTVYELLKQLYPDCLITISDFDKYYYEFKICCRKVAKIKIMSSSPEECWRTEIAPFDYSNGMYAYYYARHNDRYGHIPLTEVYQYLENHRASKIDEAKDILPLVIKHVRKNIDTKVTYGKPLIGGTASNPIFSRSIGLYGETIDLKQFNGEITIKSEDSPPSYNTSVPLADPQCFEKIRQSVLSAVQSVLDTRNAHLEHQIKVSQDEILEHNKTIKEVVACKNKVPKL